MNRKFKLLVLFCFFLIGSVHAMNQALVSDVSASVNGGNAMTGMLISMIYTGSLIFVLLSGSVMDRLGKRTCATVSAAMTLAGLLMITLFRSGTVYVIAYFIIGGGLGSLEGACLSLTSDLYGDAAGKYINRFNIMYSIGGVLAPLMTAFLLARFAYTSALLFFGFFALIAVVSFILFRSIDSFAVRVTERKRSVIADYLHMLRYPPMLLVIIAMFLYMASESVFSYWVAQYFRDLGYERLSSIALSLFWIAGIAGLYTISLVKDIPKFIPLALVLSGLFLILEAVVPLPAVKLILVFLFGFTCAPMYSNLSYLGGKLFPEMSGMSYSLMLFSASLGGIIVQPVVGGITNLIPISTVYIIFGVILLITALLPYIAERIRNNAN